MSHSASFHLSENIAPLKSGTKHLAGTQQFLPDLVALLEENKKLKQQLKTTEMEKECLKKR
ncbi:hypothetical protein B6S39_14640 [Enterococcus faecalis]|uniref:Uncharacterized protein n=1 Tax=Acinetobacter baumannii 21072 TaxID=1310697 RepID=A0A062HYY6_ACIBA|nr:hypothetical protein J596_3930 [Acinetobacter baumannii 21072]OSM15273.1 hypothetical protein B6S39_14640 [Enterococcus faecalis]